jgi:hypothetical protein
VVIVRDNEHNIAVSSDAAERERCDKDRHTCGEKLERGHADKVTQMA